jgi:hypothetical protein
MLMQHAESRGHPYDRIILSRPDMFHWSDFDMREYSDEMVSNFDRMMAPFELNPTTVRLRTTQAPLQWHLR